MILMKLLLLLLCIPALLAGAYVMFLLAALYVAIVFTKTCFAAGYLYIKEK